MYDVSWIQSSQMEMPLPMYTHSHTQTLSFDRFSNAVHWFHLRWCCCYCCFCLPFSDVRVNLAWESKQWVTEVIYSVHRPIDTEKWHKVWMKTNKNVTRSVSHFFSLLFFLEKGRLGRRTLVILGSLHKQKLARMHIQTRTRTHEHIKYHNGKNIGHILLIVPFKS